MIKNVAITGGVHGNELTGAYLIKKWLKKPIKSNLNIDYILANPKAFKMQRRYIDYDLNRSFSKEALSKDSHFYEFERAKVLKERVKNCDFLIDLHTTTSNMNMSIVLSKDDDLSNNLAKALAKEFKDIKILRWLSNNEGEFINSIVPHSITLEAGAICQGVLDPNIFFRCDEIVTKAVKILENIQNLKIDEKIEAYEIVKVVDFPRINKEISAVIHPNLIGKDYCLINKKDPIFLDFEKNEILYEGDPLFAVFINEAAYYEKSMAFCLCKKVFI